MTGDEHEQVTSRGEGAATGWRSLPVVQSWTRGSRSLRALLVLVAAYGVFQLLVAVSPPVQRAAMAHMQLASGSYGLWALQHARPAMYNFANEYFLGPLPLTSDNVDDDRSLARQQAHQLWLNHYPFQVPLWWYRRDKGAPDSSHYLLLRSRFQHEEVITRWRLLTPPEGARGMRFVELK
jgi:hypothetical protein